MKVAVYCGSSLGIGDVFELKTKELGCYFGENGVDIVYGGGKVGLMGIIADSVLRSGGKVYGVIPKQLKEREIAHTGITELHVVESMHERKAKMSSMADAFIALPGGAGTLEEIFEAWTWGQLGEHSKPCALYNPNGFYDPLLSMVDTMVNTGFLKREYAEMLLTFIEPSQIVDCFAKYLAPKAKWT